MADNNGDGLAILIGVGIAMAIGAALMSGRTEAIPETAAPEPSEPQPIEPQAFEPSYRRNDDDGCSKCGGNCGASCQIHD